MELLATDGARGPKCLQISNFHFNADGDPPTLSSFSDLNLRIGQADERPVFLSFWPSGLCRGRSD